jgi:hypothetical protein
MALHPRKSPLVPYGLEGPKRKCIKEFAPNCLRVLLYRSDDDA